MACNIPNISPYIEAACRDPSLIGNIEFLVEDFIARLKTDCGRNSAGDKSEAASNDKEEIPNQNTNQYSNEAPGNFIDILIKTAHAAFVHATNITEDPGQQKEATKSEPDSKTTYHENRLESREIETNIPISTNKSSDYEITLNFKGCSSDSIKLDISDGLLKATGKNDEEECTKNISYERKIPVDIDPSSLKAKFLPEGSLKISGKNWVIVPTSEVP